MHRLGALFAVYSAQDFLCFQRSKNPSKLTPFTCCERQFQISAVQGLLRKLSGWLEVVRTNQRRSNPKRRAVPPQTSFWSIEAARKTSKAVLKHSVREYVMQNAGEQQQCDRLKCRQGLSKYKLRLCHTMLSSNPLPRARNTLPQTLLWKCLV